MNNKFHRSAASVRHSVDAACKRIAPLWPLADFVAVNPFLGLADRPFADAVHCLRRNAHGDMLMPANYYHEQIQNGRVSQCDFHTAIAMAGHTAPPLYAGETEFPDLESLRNALRAPRPAESAARMFTVADFLDQQQGTAWAAFVTEEISKWCSVYFDQGQSSWRMPWRGLDLLTAWREAARRDANPELTGMKNFRKLVAALPDGPLQIIAEILDQLGVPPATETDFLHRELLTISGWGSHVQYQGRQQGLARREEDPLAQLLAIRLVYDLGLAGQLREGGLLPPWQASLKTAIETTGVMPRDLRARYLAHLAVESAFQNRLIWQLTAAAVPPARDGRNTLQAVFCIDVRSEPFRRALEAQSGEIETRGFAGFFGMPIAYRRLGHSRDVAQCPVLLTPRFRIKESIRGRGATAEKDFLARQKFQKRGAQAWESFKTSAVSCFSFVETAGLAYGPRLWRDTWWAVRQKAERSEGADSPFAPQLDAARSPATPDDGSGIPLAEQIGLAADALRNLGLTSDFGRFVLFCGHGGESKNNPYAAALDCGACGGHAGDVNARVIAGILNQPAVRAALADQGICIPGDTLFLAGCHNTTTDEVVLYEWQQAPSAAAGLLAAVRAWLAAASQTARQERATALGLGGTRPEQCAAAISARARDWAQTRPEWGLAGNAAFIAAPGNRTKGLNLHGRVFLHHYDYHQDAGQKILELIMLAPMVVASWINLQYFGSTVNNALFGSGNKVLHNVVGTIGIWQGNGGDLQTGLPLQSLHDGARWRHEPLRLSVFLAAPCTAISRILETHQPLRELADNAWIHLFALPPDDRTCWRYVPSAGWAKAPGENPGLDCALGNL